MDTPGIQTMLGAAGACPEIPFKGKLWRIGHPTQRSKSTLEELAAAKASSEIRALKNVLPAEAYKEHFRELNSSLAAGDYRTWRSGWQSVVLNAEGAHLFLLALLRENHPNATEREALALCLGEPELVGAALTRVVPGFFDLLMEDLPIEGQQRTECEAIIKEAVAGLTARSKEKSPTSNPPPSPTIRTNSE